MTKMRIILAATWSSPPVLGRHMLSNPSRAKPRPA